MSTLHEQRDKAGEEDRYKEKNFPCFGDIVWQCLNVGLDLEWVGATADRGTP